MKSEILIVVLFIGAGCAQPMNGLPGPKGDKGDPGQPGTPTNQITVIKFCKEQPVYPSTFPEQGLCIDNQLYAVYSANGGFLAELPAGRYESNAIGSSCSFTVGANCTVTE